MVCYLIRSHRNPVQVSRLVRTIRRGSPDSLIVLAHDDAAERLDDSLVAGTPGVHVRHGISPARRGRFENMRPYFEAIDWLLDTPVAFDWLVFLSGQDYPARPLADFERHLCRRALDGMLQHWDAFSADGPWGRSRRGYRRYYFQYRDPPAWTHPLLTLLRPAINSLAPRLHVRTSYGVRVGARAARTPFTERFRCHVGLPYHALSRACVEYVRDACRANPQLVAYYARTEAPDESLIQTVLANSGRFRFERASLHYADTEGRKDGSARVLTMADAQAIAASGRFFARKFDEAADGAVLDWLDGRLAVVEAAR